MAPRIIKKYPNRRLYDTETSTYITLAEVKDLVLQYKLFQVQDAKSGEDLTRAIMLQIILEEESGGVPMFSQDMLANIIRYYGHAMQGLMGSYLERSIFAFHEAQKRFQAQASTLYGELPKMPFTAGMPGVGPQIPNVMGGYLEKGAKAVIDMQEELRSQALKLSRLPYSAGGRSRAARRGKAPIPRKDARKPRKQRVIVTQARASASSRGLPKAASDSEGILNAAARRGLRHLASYEGSDLVVINTCGFIAAAVEESLDAIGEALAAKRQGDRHRLPRRQGDVVRKAHPRCGGTGPHATRR